MGRVVVVGSVNADYVVRVARLPRAGETVGGGALEVLAGGKGANQAHAAARMGAAVTLVAAVGADAAGRAERAALEAAGVDTSCLAQRDGPTGVAVIFVDARGENMIAVAPGANDLLDPAQVAAQLRGLLGAGDVVLASMEVPLAVVEAAAGAAVRAGAAMVLNTAPAAPLPPVLLDGVVLTPNEGEVRQLVPDAPSEEKAVETLLAAGARAVVITRGGQGASLLRAGERAAHFPAPRVQVADTVGAGDAFNGALAAALAGGRSLDDAVPRAVAAGGLACTGAGARSALPSPADVTAVLEVGAPR